ncbi:hypothetical protein ACFE04_024714 [Oxalis oulophora]
MDVNIPEKALKIEEIIESKMKPVLVAAVADRSDLKRNIENLEKYNITSLQSMINLGSEVYVQADVPDTQHIFVDIGLGFHVEFTWSEALDFISLRLEKLKREEEVFNRKIAAIKADIKMMHELYQEELQIPVGKPRRERIF